MNNYTIITARTSSKRLPKKILKKFGKFRTIDIIINRAKKIGLPIILATSNLKSDDNLVSYVKKKYKVNFFRGSHSNVLKRWQDCFKKFKVNYACMVDADDLLFDYSLYKSAIKMINKKKYELITKPKKIIVGIFTHIISSNLISKSKKKFKNQSIEFIEPVFKKLNLKTHIMKTKLINKNIRLTLDYHEDYLFFQILFNKFKITTPSKTVINFLEKNNKLTQINYFREKSWKDNQNKLNTIA